MFLGPIGGPGSIVEIDEAMLCHSLFIKGRKPEGLVENHAPLDMDLRQDEDLPVEGLLYQRFVLLQANLFVSSILKRVLKTVFTLQSVLSRFKSF